MEKMSLSYILNNQNNNEVKYTRKIDFYQKYKLKKWILNNIDHPYPSPIVKLKMLEEVNSG